MKAVSIDALHKAAQSKPAGYLADVLSYVAEKKDTHVLFEDGDYYALRDKYTGDVDPLVRGVGTELHKLLGMVGIHMQKGCACRARMTQMNKWGCDGCEENMETVLEWLKEEAAKRRLPFVRVAAALLVRRAIFNARREARRATKSTA